MKIALQSGIRRRQRRVLRRAVVLARRHVRLLAGVGLHRRVPRRDHGPDRLPGDQAPRRIPTAPACRPTAETRPVQKLINVGIIASVVAVAVVSALDHRFGWSSVPTAVVIVGDVLVAVGIGIAYVVIVQNNYAAATITVEAGQPVVSTGPVRHRSPSDVRRGARS